MLTTLQRNDGAFGFSYDVALLSSQRITYNGDGNVEYIGFAAAGSREDEPAWLIKKCTYDGSGNLIATGFANGKILHNNLWSDREGYDYA